MKDKFEYLANSGFTTTMLTAISRNRYLELFLTDTDKKLWYRFHKGGDSAKEWSDCYDLGNGIASSPIVIHRDEYLELFVTGTDNKLWYKFHKDGSDAKEWSDWYDLGNGVASSPAIIHRDGYLELFVTGTDNQLWYRFHKDGSGAKEWSGWYDLGNGVDSSPTVIHRDGCLELFITGTDNKLWYRFHKDGSGAKEGSCWYDLGNGVASSPTVIHRNGYLELFIISTDNKLWYRFHKDGDRAKEWSDWYDLGNGVASSPAIIHRDGYLELFVTGTDNKLWYRFHKDGRGAKKWSDWYDLGNGVASSPTVIHRDGYLELFITGTGNKLWYMSHKDGGSAKEWSCWYELRNEVWNKELFMKDQFECLVNIALEKAVMDNTNNAVLFVGETRSGKSSFICYLLGCKMEFQDINRTSDILIAKDCPTKKVPKIGHDSASQTLFPAGYKKDDNMYIDFAGIEDTRSADQSLLAALATQVAIKTIKSIKRIVIVIDFNDIKNKNAKNLAKIINSMSSMFKNFNKHKNDISLVVSKLELKNEPLDKQKQRIINQLISFDKAIQAGNYRNDVKDLSVVHDFLSIFINSKGYNNLVLFNPLNPSAKDEIISQINSKKEGFSPDALNFVGDEKQKKQFFEKARNSLKDAIDVLNTLLGYPKEKIRLEDEIKQVENNIKKLDTEINKIEQEPEPTVSPPNSEAQFREKREKTGELSVALQRLTAREAIVKDKISKIESHDTVKGEVSWREQDHYSAEKGYPHSNTYMLEIKDKGYIGKKPDIEISSTDCKKIGEYSQYYCTSICGENPVRRYKDGILRCDFPGGHRIIDETGKTWIGWPENRQKSALAATVTLQYGQKSQTTICYVGGDDVGTFERPGAQDHISQEEFLSGQETYKVKYHTPEYCYGYIKASYEVTYRSQPAIKKELSGHTQELQDLEKSISENKAQSVEINHQIANMQNQNNEAQKKAKSKASERKAKLVLDKQKRQDLKTNKLNAGRDLKVLEKSHEDAFKIYCVHQTFWQQLITLHRVIKFDFEQYNKFNELFSSYSVEKQKCEKLVEPLACKEFEEPEAENFHNTCGNANGEKCNTFANGASLESGHFINNIYDIDNYIVTYDTNKRMSAARESLSYQFFSLTAKSINFFKQTAYIAAQQASSSFSTAADSVNGVSEYFTNMHNTEIYNQPENQIQVINPNSFNISDIFVVSRCQQSNLSESRLVSGCIVNESDSFTKFIAQNEYISHEREQSDTTYTPSPLNFAGDIDSNLMLSSIWIHVLKESYSWATRMFSSENIVEEKEQAEASHGYITEIFCESKKELQNINRLIRSLTINRRDPEDYSWAQDALEYRREELRDLQRKPKIFLSDLEEMKLDILHLKNEIQNELTPIETILGGNTSKNLSKFGIFSANTTTHLNINMKALINQRTEIPILPSNAANNYFGR